MGNDTNFLDQPTLVEQSIDPRADAAPERVGPYRLGKLLGRGGMGVVYLAEQLVPVRRQVALKLMQEALSEFRGRAYFEVECQALARMEHPAIARLYDAGTTDKGRPYLAMEWVDGKPLTEYCDHHDLDLKRRLQLFQRLCQGVSHVHQRGLIHRDLKPANVLVREVDGEPWPTLIDFGIAISTRIESNKNGQAAGTDTYMSPEQRSGDGHLDTRSDVYALGVLLLQLVTPRAFELAASAPSQDDSGWQAIVSGEASEGPARELAKSVAGLPRTLRTILHRALATDRDQRYASVIELSEDVENWLHHRPIKAGAVSRWERTRLFARRHRGPLLTGSIVVLALVVGLLAALHGLIQARDALARADQEANKAGQVADFLGELLTGVDPTIARDMDATLLRKLLDEAAERAASEWATEPDIRSELEFSIGRSYAALIDTKAALPFLRSSWEQSRAAQGEAAPTTIERLQVLVDTLLEEDQTEQAKELAEEGLRALAEAGRSDSLQATLLMGSAAWIARRREGAGAAIDGLIEVARRLEQQLPSDDPKRLRQAYYLAITLGDLERFDEAEAIYDSVLAAWTASRGADHPDAIAVRNSRAVLALQQDDPASAATQLEALLPDQLRVFGPESIVSVVLYANLAGALRQSGRREESAPYYRKAYELTVGKLGEDHPRSIMVTHNYGNYLVEAGEIERGVELHRQAVAGSATAFARNRSYYGVHLAGLGKAETAAGDWHNAEQHLTQSLTEIESELPKTHRRARQTVEALIALYQAWGDRPEELARWQAHLEQISAPNPG